MAKKVEKIDLKKQVEKIIDKAENAGVEHNMLFVTTLKRYGGMLKILDDLSKDIESRGAVTERVFSSGKIGIGVNESVAVYNQTSNMANLTAASLLNIVAAAVDGKGLESLNMDDGDDL